MSSADDSFQDGAMSTSLIGAIKLTRVDSAEGWSLLHDVIGTKPDMDQVDEDGFSALMYAVRYNMPDLIPYLINAGASVDLKDVDGNTPLYYATMFGFSEVMSALVQMGADPNIHDQYGTTLLEDAIDSQNLNLMETLLELGASPNELSDDGTSPLLLALCHPHLPCCVTILNVLLDAGADPNIVRESDGITPLMVACQPHHRNTQAVRVVVGGGADLELRDKESRTALHHTAFTANLAVLKALIRAGADLNASDKTGLCALGQFYFDITGPKIDAKSDLNLLSLYLHYGADPNLVTSSLAPGALMTAVIARFGLEGARLLLAHGAQPKPHEEGHLPSVSPFQTLVENLEDSLPTIELLVNGLYFTDHDVYLCAEQDNSNHTFTALLAAMRDIPTLKQLCRRKIHSSLGCVKHRCRVVDNLPIAPKLRRYILFQEVHE